MNFMKQMKLWMTTVIMTILGTSVLTTSCSDDEENVDPAQVVGQWYAEKSMRGKVQTCYPRTSDDPVDFDKIGVEVNLLADGKGNWALYYLNGDQMENADGYFYADFTYTLSSNGRINIKHTGVVYEDVLSDFSYSDGQLKGEIDCEDLVAINSDDEFNMTFSRCTDTQKEFLEDCHTILNIFHLSGDDDLTLKEVYEAVLAVKNYFGYVVAEDFVKNYINEGYTIFILKEGIYFGGHVDATGGLTHMVDYEYFIPKD